MPSWVPGSIGLLLALASFVAWQALSRQEVTQVSRLVAEEAARLEVHLAGIFESRILALERMASRWVFDMEHGNERTRRPEWTADARSYVEHEQGFQAIEWADRSFHVRWIVPLAGNESEQDLDLRFEERRRETVEAAHSQRMTTVSDAIELVQGERGLLIAVPLFPDGAFDGLILGVFSYREVLEPPLAQPTRRGFRIEVRSAGELVYESSAAGSVPAQGAWSHSGQVPIRNVILNVLVEPTPRLVASVQSAVPLAALVVGLLIAALVAAALQLARGRRRVEEALQASDRQFREFFEKLDVGAFRSLPSGAILAINEAAAQMLGYESVEELKTASAEDLYVDPMRRQELWELLKTESGVARAELAMRRKDGTQITVEASGRAVRDEHGDTLYHEGTLTDITERKRAGQALRESERQFREFFENVGVGAFRTTPAGEFLAANSALAELLGFDSVAELMDVRVDDLYADPELRQRDVRETEAKRILRDFEIVLRHQDGRKVVALATSRAVADETGQTLYFEGTLTDITERKRAEEALVVSEETHRSLVENLIEGIVQTSAEGRFLAVNMAMVEMLGYDSKEELLELNLARDVWFRPEERGAMLERVGSGSILRDFEMTLKRRDGSAITVLANIRAFQNAAGQLERMEGSVVDITARKQLEEQLRQSQKMEAVGLLAGGVAHDFNNLLTGLSGFTELALQKIRGHNRDRLGEVASSIVNDLLEVRKAADRAAGLTRQLLAFSRQQVLHPQVVDLNSVVQGIERLLRRTIGEDIELSVELSEDSSPVLVDPGQIEQVLLNLAINARDAMPGGGEIRVRTGEVELDERFGAGEFVVVPGSYAQLVVEDSGEGMDEETRRRALEPFFSTKGPGGGSGLGLSMVYGIVKQSRGYLWIDSTPGEGTRVDVYLPCLDREADVEAEALPAPVTPVSGRGTVLLVEDDTLVRRLAARVLDSGGYEVLSAASADSAMELFEKRKEAVDLVVTDIVMPGGSGTDLVDRLQATEPGLKVLYISGHPTEEVRRRGVLDSDNFLGKPFTPDELLARVHDLLTIKSLD